MKIIKHLTMAAIALAMICGCEKQDAELKVAIDKESLK